LASPLRSRLAIASGRIEIIIILFMDWSFASGCSPPRLSATQLPSATDKPVFLSDRDFHPTVGTYSQAHSSTAFRALAPAASFPWLVGKESIALALMRHFGSLAALSRASFRNCGNSFHSRKRRLIVGIQHFCNREYRKPRKIAFRAVPGTSRTQVLY